MKKLKIGYFYSDLLNLYGDNGNVEILLYRALRRGYATELVYVGLDTKLDSSVMSGINLIFMGGGPDASQQNLYQDLVENKGPYIRDYVEQGGVGLFICGSYQLFGHYYKAADQSILGGLGIFRLHTEHFGNHKSRCIGNICIESSLNLDDATFGNTLVGFENHGGRTYLDSGTKPFGRVLGGFGNNGEDFTEGAMYKNAIGTYLHGPILSKNPHFADYLLKKSLGVEELPILEDNLIHIAHDQAKKLCI